MGGRSSPILNSEPGSASAPIIGGDGELVGACALGESTALRSIGRCFLARRGHRPNERVTRALQPWGRSWPA
jgi:hypothetical protein